LFFGKAVILIECCLVSKAILGPICIFLVLMLCIDGSVNGFN